MSIVLCIKHLILLVYLTIFLSKSDIYICKNEMFYQSYIIQNTTTNTVDGFINL